MKGMWPSGLPSGFHWNPGGLPTGFYWNHRVVLWQRYVTGGRAIVMPGTHRRIQFDYDYGSAEWVLDAKERWRYQLKSTPGYYYFFDPETERVTVFERGGGQYCYAIQTVDRNGNALTYTNGADVSSGGPASVHDGLGRSLHFSYDQVGGIDTNRYLTRLQDQTGRHWDFTYEFDPADNPGQVTLRSLTEPLGGVTSFRYAGQGTNWIAAMTLPRGNTPYTQTYDLARSNAVGVVRTQTDALGNTWQFVEEEFGGTWGELPEETRFSVINPDGTRRSFTHGNEGTVLTRIVAEDGQHRVFAPGVNGKVQSEGVTDPEGRSVRIGYDAASGQVNELTNGRGFAIRHVYGEQTQQFDNPVVAESVTFTFQVLTATHFPDGTSETYARDTRGNVTQRVDRAGAVWVTDYDSRGQPIRIGSPAGGEATFVYNADGTLRERTDPETGTTSYAYDALKRPMRTTYPDGTTVGIAYDALDRLVSHADERSNTTSFAYDANGNLVSVTDATGHASRTEYDALDRSIASENRLGRVWTRTYDDMGRPASTRDPTGLQRHLGYDPAGRLVAVTIGRQTWRILRDAAGKAVGSTTPQGFTHNATLDAVAHPAAGIDPLGNQTHVARDSMNVLVSTTDPLGNMTSYTNDARDYLNGVTYPGRGSTTYDWSNAGQLTTISDLNGQSWAVSNSPQGRVLAVTDPLGQSMAYDYDERGRITRVTFPDGGSLSNTYDAAGNPINRHYSDGTDHTYAYDALNRLTNASGIAIAYDAEGRPITTVTHGRTHGATYDAAGRLRTITCNNRAITVTYTHDHRGVLTHVSDDLTETQLDFAYDDDHRPTTVTRDSGVDTSYTWDAAARLVRIQHGDIIDLQYTCDAAGRIVGVDIAAPLLAEDHVAEHDDRFSHDAASQVSGGGYVYDARGRVTRMPGHTFTWDDASRLTGLDAVSLSYNALGTLATRNVGGATTHYHYNAALPSHPIVAEQDQASGEITRYYVTSPGGTLLYMIEMPDRTVRHFHFDHLGSTLALTDADGNVTDSYAYDAFGRLLAHQGPSTQPFTFVGRYGVRRENDTLYHMKARYYDAQTARFLTREPIWPQLGDPRKLNPYQYALASPLNRIDPTGTEDTLLNDLWMLSDDDDEWEKIEDENGDPISNLDDPRLQDIRWVSGNDVGMTPREVRIRNLINRAASQAVSRMSFLGKVAKPECPAGKAVEEHGYRITFTSATGGERTGNKVWLLEPQWNDPANRGRTWVPDRHGGKIRIYPDDPGSFFAPPEVFLWTLHNREHKKLEWK